MKYLIIVGSVLFGGFLVQATAQDQSELDRFEDTISHHLMAKMPEWKHTRGEPITGSEGVLTEFWSFSTRIVKISIVPLKSANEAREKLQNFAQETKEAEVVKGLGDEAYSWGFENSNIVVRRGRSIVFLSTVVDVDHDSDARMISETEKRSREHSEMKRLSREFAKHITDAIDLL